MTEPTSQDIIGALQRGMPAEAERLCRARLISLADDEDALLFLALSLQQQNRHGESVEYYRALTRCMPDSAMHWGNYSTGLRMARQLDEACVAASTAIRLAPDDPHQRINLGLAQLELDKYEEALVTLLEARELDPLGAAPSILAARACCALRDPRVITLLKPWRRWLPLDDADMQLELAHLLMTISDASAAFVVLEDLLRKAPMHLAAKLQLAAVYERRNQTGDAEALLDHIIADHPKLDREAQLELMNLRGTLALRRGDAPAARVIFEQYGPRHDLDYAQYFALAGVVDKLGDTSAAMNALAIAHARQLDELRAISPLRFAADAPILPNAVARMTVAQRDAWPTIASPTAAQSPIFIIGFPRSGTTLLEQMLDAHPALQSMDERPFFAILGGELNIHGVRLPEDLHRLNQRDCDELRSRYLDLVCEKVVRRWDAQLVDKNPLNMLWLPLIMRLFPEAKFILALRHPCDVVLSNYMQNYWSSVLATACSSLTRTAIAYVEAMRAWLHHADLFEPTVLVSRYEDLVDDFPRQTQRIAEFLELDDATPMLQFDRHAREKGFIATPSYTQVIQPVNRKGLDRWHRYRSQFEAVLPILQPMLEHWNYPGT